MRCWAKLIRVKGMQLPVSEMARPNSQKRPVLGFIEAFYQALLRRYADGLLEFDQDQVSVLPYRGDVSKPRAKVKSTVKLNDGTKIAVDYELVKRDAGWLLFNVIIEGVSYVRNFRTELNSEIRSSSLDAVIERLEGEAGI